MSILRLAFVLEASFLLVPFVFSCSLANVRRRRSLSVAMLFAKESTQQSCEFRTLCERCYKAEEHCCLAEDLDNGRDDCCELPTSVSGATPQRGESKSATK